MAAGGAGRGRERPAHAFEWEIPDQNIEHHRDDECLTERPRDLARESGDKPGPSLMCKRQGSPNSIRFEPHVGVNEEKPIAPRCFRKPGASVLLADPACRETDGFHRPHAMVFCRECAQDFISAVCGFVVVHQYFEPPVSRVEHRTHGLRDVALLVPTGNTDAHEGIV